MSQHRVGIVGAGWAADKYVQAFKALDIPITWMCSRSVPRARSLLDAHGFPDATVTDRFDDVLSDPDVDLVVIASPNHAHANQAVAAAERGKHLIVEKPVCISVEELARVVDAVRRARVQSMVGFVQRAGLYQQQVKQYILQGLVGRPFFSEVGYVTYQVPERFVERAWMRSTAATGSSFLLSGIHGVDSIRWLASTDPSAELDVVEVQALSRRTRLETEYDDFAVALLRFSDDSIGTVSSHLSSYGANVPAVTIFGDQGTIRGDELWTEATSGPRGWMKIPQPHPLHQGFPALYCGHVARFLEALGGGGPAPCDIASTINTHEVCFAAEQSARQGRPVRLPLGHW